MKSRIGVSGSVQSDVILGAGSADALQRASWRPRLSDKKALLASELRSAGIRINPSVADPWDIMVQDEEVFARRLLSPLRNGLTELGDMYVEGLWKCEDVSEFFYRCLRSGLNARFSACLPNVLQYLADRIFNRQTRSSASQDVR